MDKNLIHLAIESGKYKNIARNERRCTFCNHNNIEDVFRIMLKCSVYNSYRIFHFVLNFPVYNS